MILLGIIQYNLHKSPQLYYSNSEHATNKKHSDTKSEIRQNGSSPSQSQLNIEAFKKIQKSGNNR